MIIEDQAARDRARLGHRTSMILEAGAGSGKTTTLVDRAIQGIREGGNVEKQIAITFTVKAAWELLTRLRSELRASDDANAKGALASLAEMRVGTIDSVVQRMLEDHALEAGLAAGFTILGESAFALRVEEWFAASFREWNEDPRLESAWSALHDAGVTLSQIERTLRELANEVIRYGRAPFVEGQISDVEALETWTLRHLEPALRTLQDWRTLPVAPKDEAKKAQNLQKFLEFVNCLEARAPELLADPFSAWVPPKAPGNAGGATAKPTTQALKNARDELKNLAGSLKFRRITPLLQRVVDDAATLSQKMDRRGELGFDRALGICIQMLKENPELLESVRSGIESVMFDEFQDTSPQQIEFARLLSNDGQVPLFVVGDPKQAIYEFRGADVANYLAFRQHAPASGLALEALTCNFRSQPSVLRLTNAVFADRLTFGDDGYTELIPRARFTERVPDVHVHCVGGPVPNPSEADAETALSAISNAISEGWLVRERDQCRPIRFSDITVLYRTRKTLKRLVPMLVAAGIPYRVEGNTDVLASDEARAVVSVLRAISLREHAHALPPNDRLRGVYPEGESPENVRIAYVAAAQSLGLALPLSASFAEIEKHLERFQFLADKTPHHAVSQLIRGLKVEALAGLSDRPRHVINALRTLADTALAAESMGVSTVREFVNLIDAGTFDELDESPSEEMDEQAVRLMTVHNAKGLEFPMVVVLGFDGFARPHGSMIRDEDRLWLRVGTKELGLQPNGFQERLELKNASANEGLWRLLYVALTRAKDHLIFSLAHVSRKDENPPDRNVARVCFGMPDVQPWIRDRLPQTEINSFDLPAPFVAADASSIRSKWAEAEHKEARTTPSRMAREAGLTKEPFGEEDPDPAEGEESSSGLPSAQVVGDMAPPSRTAAKSGTAFGLAVHLALQQVRFDGSNLQEVAGAAANLYGCEAAEVRAFVSKALSMPTLREAASAANCVREAYVAHLRTDGTLIEGVLDLMYSTPEGEIVVVDYKTDKITTRTQAELRMERGYTAQGVAYAELVSSALGLEVNRVEFVFLNPTDPVALTMSSPR